MIIKRGDIFLAELDPAIGSEINKTRPAIIVSNNLANTYSNTDKIFPYEVLIEAGEGNLPKNSKAKANQVRTLDKIRLIKYIGTLASSKMKQVDNALRIHFDL